MKSKLGAVVITILMTALLTQHPPITSEAKEPASHLSEIKSLKENIDDKSVVDSVMTFLLRMDSVKSLSKKRLNTLKKQQKHLLRQMKTIDTLTLSY